MFVIFDDWDRLPGAMVEIWAEGTLVRIGLVDAATDDSTIAWIAADGPFDRCLVEKSRGFELRVSGEEWLRRSEWAV